LLGGLLVCAPSAFAQAKNPARNAQRPKAEAGARVEQQKKLVQDLKLTDEQKTKYKTLLQEEAKQRKELRENTALTPQERRAKAKETRDATTAKVKKVLTPEQFEKWEKARQTPKTRPVEKPVKSRTKPQK
jgi:Spy/CpxP family protein refolding chaperone